MNEELKVGDRVEHKTGGPYMIISETVPSDNCVLKYRCHWWDSDRLAFFKDDFYPWELERSKYND